MRLAAAAVATLLCTQPLAAAPCGGDFTTFLDAMAAEASAAGAPPDSVKAFFKGAALDPAVLKADRSQGVFRKTFLDFSKSLISKNLRRG